MDPCQHTVGIFLSQFGYAFLNIFTYFRISQPVLFGVVYSLFFSGTVPAGAILFGIAFWNISRHINRIVVKRYMIISAYGIIIIFSSNQAYALIRVFYPPFGLISLSFFGLASYLILIGIYSAAVSVAQDSELRKTIRHSVEVGILGEIGRSQAEADIMNRINRVSMDLAAKSEEMNEFTGISTSLGKNEIKKYLEEVVEEIRKTKKIS